MNYLKLTEQYGDRVLASLRENGQLSLKRVNSKAKEALGDGVWSPDLKIKVCLSGLKSLSCRKKMGRQCVL